MKNIFCLAFLIPATLFLSFPGTTLIPFTFSNSQTMENQKN